LAASQALPRGSRPSFDELDRGIKTVDRNQLAQHPPLYYAALGGWSRLTDAAPLPAVMRGFEAQVWLLRLGNVLLMSCLPLLVWWAAREFGLGPPQAIVAATGTLLIPQLTAIGSAVNNDNLFVVLCALLMIPLARICRGSLDRRIHLAAAGIMGAALLVKGFALVLPLWYATALAALVLARRTYRSAAGTAILAGVVTMSIGGWWWVHNVVAYGALQPSIQESRLAPPPPGFVPDYGKFVHTLRTTLPRRFWGDFGAFDVHLPDRLTVALSVTLLLAIGLGALRRHDHGGLTRGARAVLLVPIGTLGFVLVGGALDSYRSTAQFAFQQGRYLFGAIPSMMILAATAASPVIARHPRRVIGGVLAGAATLQGFALLTVLGEFWGPVGRSFPAGLRAAAAWSPLPGWLDLVTVGVAVVTAAALVTVVATEPSRLVTRRD
ncbi:MAG: hypothetical protein ACT4OV_13655, partial [Microthrixaceae bacterium]